MSEGCSKTSRRRFASRLDGFLHDSRAVMTSVRSQSVPLLESFQIGLPVRLIGTPRAELMTCEAEEPIADVVARNRETKFDFLPVVEPANTTRTPIIGLFEAARFMHAQPPSGLVHEAMHPLSEPYLVGADSSIIEFIRRADVLPCRLIVSGDEISGLVCLYDIQKLPARAALFAMVTSLEMAMTELIRAEFPEQKQWLALVKPKRKKKLDDEIAKAQAADAFVDALLMTQFCDKATILRNLSISTSRRKLSSDMNQIERLRNSLAHANEYATTRDQAGSVCHTVRLIDQWLAILAAPMAQIEENMQN